MQDRREWPHWISNSGSAKTMARLGCVMGQMMITNPGTSMQATCLALHLHNTLMADLDLNHIIVLVRDTASSLGLYDHDLDIITLHDASLLDDAISTFLVWVRLSGKVLGGVAALDGHAAKQIMAQTCGYSIADLAAYDTGQNMGSLDPEQAESQLVAAECP
jgi:hypothetical protein